MKNQIDILTAKLSSLSKTGKVPGDDITPIKHKTDYSTKPAWSDPSTMKDPCFLWASNKGLCKDTNTCSGHIQRPHAYPINASDADIDKFKTWVNSKDSPTFYHK